ncbi:hypothetical protein SAMN02745157_0858 [Kaistia soli DSM 19436]|uniref:Uncharacterized protein n=1 Tax=Kaistia soli DSM 19436 TaxID=1122133 RepID=A0A1M4W295_9HYPH|nr:hypothetical protein [Kaistia soli]SHE75336.1 hypothetical protein SAMN02745157_0858 [Kaistia soli DSM 19436]
MTERTSAESQPLGTERLKIDPFRPLIHFLVGHIAFALAILAAMFTSLPKKGSELVPPLDLMLGGILFWMSISALLGAVCALIAHLLKTGYFLQREEYRRPPSTLLVACLGLLPIIPGIFAVAYAMRGGAAMLARLPTLPDLCSIPSLVF